MVNIVGLDFSSAPEDVKQEIKGGKFLGVGLHEVAISEAAIQEPKADADPNWATCMVTFAKDEATTKAFVEFPLNMDGFNEFKGKTTAAQRKRNSLAEFFEALGVVEEVTKENLGPTIGKCFGDPSKLVGLKVEIEMAYRNNAARPDHIGSGNFHLIDKEGNVVKEGDSAKVFGDAKECKAYAEAQGWFYAGFPNVTRYYKLETPNDLRAFGGTKAVEVAGYDEEDEDELP